MDSIESITIPKTQFEEYRIKAEKWDKLGEEIAKFYPVDDDSEPENNGDICDIGEKACIAFGWL